MCGCKKKKVIIITVSFKSSGFVQTAGQNAGNTGKYLLKVSVFNGSAVTEVKCNHFCRYQTVYVDLNHYSNACCVLLKYKKLSSVSSSKVTA